MIKELIKLFFTLVCFIIVFLIIFFSILTGYGKIFKDKAIDSFIKECLFDWN